MLDERGPGESDGRRATFSNAIRIRACSSSEGASSTSLGRIVTVLSDLPEAVSRQLRIEDITRQLRWIAIAPQGMDRALAGDRGGQISCGNGGLFAICAI